MRRGEVTSLMALEGGGWDQEVIPGEELALDSPGCGWESWLCHSLAVTFPGLLSLSELFPQVQNGAGAPPHTRGSEARPADVTHGCADAPPQASVRAPRPSSSFGCLQPTTSEQFSLGGGQGHQGVGGGPSAEGLRHSTLLEPVSRRSQSQPRGKGPEGPASGIWVWGLAKGPGQARAAGGEGSLARGRRACVACALGLV